MFEELDLKIDSAELPVPHAVAPTIVTCTTWLCTRIIVKTKCIENG
jgi:hypothetical protein